MEEFDQIDAFLLAIHELIKSGKSINLAGLDCRVENLCLAIQKSSNEVKQACVPRLKQFLDSLDDYEEEMLFAVKDKENLFKKGN